MTEQPKPRTINKWYKVVLFALLAVVIVLIFVDKLREALGIPEIFESIALFAGAVIFVVVKLVQRKKGGPAYSAWGISMTLTLLAIATGSLMYEVMKLVA